MSEPVSSIRNLGPTVESDFAKVGITSADQIRDMGADAAYRAYLQCGKPPHFIMYYVLVMGLQGRPWNDCKGAEKAELRKRFDAIKAERAAPDRKKDRLEIEAVLNTIGVIEKRS